MIKSLCFSVRCHFILIGCFSWLSARAFANSPVFISSVGRSFAGEEVYDEYDDQDIAESEAEWLSHPKQDLETPQGDRRLTARQAVLLGAGESALWTTFSARSLNWIDQNMAWSVDAGLGHFPSGNIDSRYAFVTTAQSLGSRFQWWPSSTFPVGLSAEVGVHNWAVKAKCGSGMTAGSCADGSLNGYGGSAGTAILLSWLADENIVVEWTVMGFKGSKILHSSWSGGETDANLEGDSRGTITGSKIVSFANFSLGWRF